MIRNPLTLLRLWRRARAAAACGKAHAIPGQEFDQFGRQLGWRLLRRGRRQGISYILNPVSCVRYFEFPFAAACLPRVMQSCLDVSSPRLFSLFVAAHHPGCKVTMINPDTADIQETALIARGLGYRNISTVPRRVEWLDSREVNYDCIWAISVVEHISGSGDDTEAVKRMFGSLNKGGRLILTVPVDRKYWEEYRAEDVYQTQSRKRDNMYFFQRHYDENHIHERLLRPIERTPLALRWFGERAAGYFRAYEQRWIRDGLACTVDDPCEIANHYQEYPTWSAMPGAGVCGLVVEK